MNLFERKKSMGMCTWKECTAPGIHSHTDVDEPSGAKLLLCDKHDKIYMEQLETEASDAQCRGED